MTSCVEQANEIARHITNKHLSGDDKHEWIMYGKGKLEAWTDWLNSYLCKCHKCIDAYPKIKDLTQAIAILEKEGIKV